jgi:hypothetical protein
MAAQKFDEVAAAEPFAFVGATARRSRSILELTIDRMVEAPSNVSEVEAASAWGLPPKVYASLKSHSATDISEAAFKHFGGDMVRFQNVVGDAMWAKWTSNAARAGGEVVAQITRLEAEYASREIRRADLVHALFHLGRELDAEGRVRNAVVYRSTLMTTKAAKHYIETGKSVEDAIEMTAREAAVAASKKDSGKRKRTAPVPTTKGDQHNVRYTMLVTQLKEHGLELDDSEDERHFIAKGPTGLGKIMASIGDIVHRRRAA